MSIIKSELKASILHEQGVKADDMLESALKRIAAHDGAKQALRQFSISVAELAKLVDRDIDQGLIPVEPLAVGEYIKRYISRAAVQAQAAAQQQENQQLSTSGEAVAYQRLVDSIKKDISGETSRIEALKQAEMNDGADEDGRREIGARPAMSIADKRREEEAAEKADASPTKVKRKYNKRKS